MAECHICYEPILNQPYAKIDNVNEVGIYHVNCLENWIRVGNRAGIISRDKITSYTIYDHYNTRQVVLPTAPPLHDEVELLVPNEQGRNDRVYSCFRFFRILLISITLIMIIILIIHRVLSHST